MDWICSRCGKKIIKREDYYSGLCFDCYKLTYTLNSIPRFLEITICPRCARYKVKDRWVSPKSADQSSMILEAANTSISKILPDDESVVEVKLIPHMEYSNELLESKSEIPVST
ncbi:MAG: NMD3-related protein, partial [Candidatus Odinarchaeota archaeon]